VLVSAKMPVGDACKQCQRVYLSYALKRPYVLAELRSAPTNAALMRQLDEALVLPWVRWASQHLKLLLVYRLQSALAPCGLRAPCTCAAV